MGKLAFKQVEAFAMSQVQDELSSYSIELGRNKAAAIKTSLGDNTACLSSDRPSKMRWFGDINDGENLDMLLDLDTSDASDPRGLVQGLGRHPEDLAG